MAENPGIIEDIVKGIKEWIPGVEIAISAGDPVRMWVSLIKHRKWLVEKMSQIKEVSQETLSKIVAPYVEAYERMWLTFLQMLYDYLLPEPPVDYEKAMKSAAKFLGLAAALMWIPYMVRITVGLVFPDRSREIARAFEQPYWLLGLGFLSWQATAIPLEYAIRAPLRRVFDSIYQYSEAPLGHIEDLYEDGLIDEKEFVELLADKGYDEKQRRIIVLRTRSIKFGRILRDLEKKRRELIKQITKAVEAGEPTEEWEKALAEVEREIKETKAKLTEPIPTVAPRKKPEAPKITTVKPEEVAVPPVTRITPPKPPEEKKPAPPAPPPAPPKPPKLKYLGSIWFTHGSVTRPREEVLKEMEAKGLPLTIARQKWPEAKEARLVRWTTTPTLWYWNYAIYG